MILFFASRCHRKGNARLSVSSVGSVDFFCQLMIRMTRICVRAVLVLWEMYTSRVAALPISSANVSPRWSNALLYSKLTATLPLCGESACPGKHA